MSLVRRSITGGHKSQEVISTTRMRSVKGNRRGESGEGRERNGKDVFARQGVLTIGRGREKDRME
jgi:hypothetical protein